MRKIRLRALLVGLALLASVPVQAATVTITRDKWGVPHIFVPPLLGNKVTQLKALGFAQGYATAADRLVQLEFFRRAGKGHLSDALGTSFLAMDKAARRDGFTDAEYMAQYQKLPGKLRIAFQAFADGVNRYITEMNTDPSKKPFELALLGINPAPWSVTDTAAIATLEVRRFGQNGGDELKNAVLLLDLMDNFGVTEAEGIFNDLVWVEDPTAPTTIDPAEQQVTPTAYTPFANAQMQMLQTYEADIRAAALVLANTNTMMAQMAPKAGIPYAHPASASNAMVISGALTDTGSPVLLGGPQVGLTLPSFFYEVGLHGGGHDEIGVTVPAGTGLVIGRNATMAWSITSGITDNTDVYLEQLDPANSHRYFYKGAYHDMDCRNETFTPSGGSPETVEYCRTIHGPVIASFPADHIAFSRKLFFFGRETKAAGNLVSLALATTMKKFQHTIDRVEASLNCMYADTSYNIAYFHRGMRILREPSLDPRLPFPGNGDGEPKKIIKGKRMPTAINPALGYIAQWNNKPIKGWSADEQRELWGGIDRVQVLADQIAADKAAHHPISSSDVANYMKVGATVDQFAKKTFPYLAAAIAALPPSTPDLPTMSAAGAFIDAWITSGAKLVADGSGNIPYPGMTIYRAWRKQVQTDTFGDELGSHINAMNYFQTSTSNNQDDSGSLFSPDALFVRALQGGPSAPFPTSRDYFANVITATNPGRDAVLVDALRTAVGTLTTQFGTGDMNLWLTPKITVKFDASASAMDFFFGSTVMEREDRGSFNEVVNLTPTAAGQIVVPPGETGFLPNPLPPTAPPHIRDQLPLYESFTYRPMPFAIGELEGPTTSQTLTLP